MSLERANPFFCREHWTKPKWEPFGSEAGRHAAAEPLPVRLPVLARPRLYCSLGTRIVLHCSSSAGLAASTWPSESLRKRMTFENRKYKRPSHACSRRALPPLHPFDRRSLSRPRRSGDFAGSPARPPGRSDGNRIRWRQVPQNHCPVISQM